MIAIHITKMLRYSFRSKDTILPTSIAPPRPSLFNLENIGEQLGLGKRKIDGSAKGIRMPNPIVEGVKNASAYTKWSWSILFIFAWMTYWGWRQCSYYAESTSLACNGDMCKLSYQTAGWKTSEINLHRAQLLNTEQIRINRSGDLVDVSKYRGRDRRNYGFSYTLVYSIPYEEGESTVTAVMSKYNINRQRARSQHSKLKYYIEGTSPKLTVRESREVTVGGVMAIVFGLFCMLITCLVGQFSDPVSPPRRRSSVSGRERHISHRARQ